MKYFEYIMTKEKEANKSVVKTNDKVEEDSKTQKTGPSKDYLPERQKYEMLCRGEGLRMVISLYIKFSYSCLEIVHKVDDASLLAAYFLTDVHIFLLLRYNSVSNFRLLEDRVNSFAGIMMEIGIPNIYWVLLSKKMNGTDLVSFASLR